MKWNRAPGNIHQSSVTHLNAWQHHDTQAGLRIGLWHFFGNPNETELQGIHWKIWIDWMWCCNSGELQCILEVESCCHMKLKLDAEVMISASQQRSLPNRLHPSSSLSAAPLAQDCIPMHQECISVHLAWECSAMQCSAIQCCAIQCSGFLYISSEFPVFQCSQHSATQLGGQSTLDFWLEDDCLGGGREGWWWSVFTCFYPTRGCRNFLITRTPADSLDGKSTSASVIITKHWRTHQCHLES